MEAQCWHLCDENGYAICGKVQAGDLLYYRGPEGVERLGVLHFDEDAKLHPRLTISQFAPPPPNRHVIAGRDVTERLIQNGGCRTSAELEREASAGFWCFVGCLMLAVLLVLAAAVGWRE